MCGSIINLNVDLLPLLYKLIIYIDFDLFLKKIIEINIKFVSITTTLVEISLLICNDE